MKIELTSEQLKEILLALPPGREYDLLSNAIAKANQRRGGEKKRDYETFCEHYNLQQDDKKSRAEYKEYERQKKIFSQLPTPGPGM